MSFHDRIASVRNLLASNAWDAVVITNPENRRYLTGYTAEDAAADESAGVVLITGSSARLLVSPTNLPLARADVLPSLIDVVPWSAPWPSFLARLLSDMRSGVVALEDATTPAAIWFALSSAVPSNLELVAAADSVDRLRAIKSEQEIALLAEAARCTDAAFLHAVDQFSPGMTEIQAANIIRDALRLHGSDGEGFATIVASGPNAAKPHHVPGSRAFVTGEPIIIDMGARIDGYNGDLSRTVCFGAPDERFVELYETVLAAQSASLGAIKAGVTASTPDKVSRDLFSERGEEDHVIHSVGHGLGLRVHEAPSVSVRAEGHLEAGNVITIEPGLYIPEWGGIRIEDVAVVTVTGYRNLTGAPKELDAMIR